MEILLNKPDQPVIKRLRELSIALEEGKKKCKEVIFTIPDSQIRKSILGIEYQSSQYAVELREQIHTLGGGFQDEECRVTSSNRTSDRKSRHADRQVFKICRKIEGSVIKLYSKALKDPIAHDGLKQLIRTQMNGIMRSTLQLKLLSKFLCTE